MANMITLRSGRPPISFNTVSSKYYLSQNYFHTYFCQIRPHIKIAYLVWFKCNHLYPTPIWRKNDKSVACKTKNHSSYLLPGKFSISNPIKSALHHFYQFDGLGEQLSVHRLRIPMFVFFCFTCIYDHWTSWFPSNHAFFLAAYVCRCGQASL